MHERFRESGGRVIKPHRYEWLWEPLESDPAFMLRAMFGCKAVYLDGKLMCVFAAKEEPWRGMLVCTEHAHQASLVADFAELVPHPILPKWLYLPESVDSFERIGPRLVEFARRRDPRIGVVPQPRKKRLSVAAHQSGGVGLVEGPSPDGPRPVGRRARQKTKARPVSSAKRRSKSC